MLRLIGKWCTNLQGNENIQRRNRLCNTKIKTTVAKKVQRGCPYTCDRCWSIDPNDKEVKCGVTNVGADTKDKIWGFTCARLGEMSARLGPGSRMSKHHYCNEDNDWGGSKGFVQKNCPYTCNKCFAPFIG